jgi:hypothetical protein
MQVFPRNLQSLPAGRLRSSHRARLRKEFHPPGWLLSCCKVSSCLARSKQRRDDRSASSDSSLQGHERCTERTRGNS